LGDRVRKRPRIIGGETSDKNEYPYAVSLEGRRGHFCGGSLIARDVVLSAAHCRDGGAYRVVVGRHSRTSSSEGETLAVLAEMPHPSYQESSTDNDFSLIFLAAPARKGDLVRLNPRDDVPAPGSRVTVMGWGDTIASASAAQTSAALQEAEVTVVANAECARAGGYVGWSYASYAGAIAANMLCAKAPGRDSCQVINTT